MVKDVMIPSVSLRVIKDKVWEATVYAASQTPLKLPNFLFRIFLSIMLVSFFLFLFLFPNSNTLL